MHSLTPELGTQAYTKKNPLQYHRHCTARYMNSDAIPTRAEQTALGLLLKELCERNVSYKEMHVY